VWLAAVALSASAAVVMLASAGAVRASTATPGPPAAPGPVGGHPMFTVQSWGGASPDLATANLPIWRGSFTLNAKQYTYRMVGTNPANGSATTTVPTQILPIKVMMADGVVLDGTPVAASLEASPIFTDAPFTSVTTQLVDAMMRAEFWSTVRGSAPDYHLLLGTPTVRPEVTITVPASAGTGLLSNGKPFAEIKDQWWNGVLKAIIKKQRFPATALGLAISGNVFLYLNNDTSDCCVYGYHGTYRSASGAHTFAYANWITKGLIPSGNSDVYSISHEVSEWANDPYVNNIVPRWDQPDGPSCFSNLLEVADTVEAMPKPWYAIKIGTTVYHPSDIGGISWFTHASPSAGRGGRYSYKGYLTAPSALC
jgi:hypothetical protein